VKVHWQADHHYNVYSIWAVQLIDILVTDGTLCARHCAHGRYTLESLPSIACSDPTIRFNCCTLGGCSQGAGAYQRRDAAASPAEGPQLCAFAACTCPPCEFHAPGVRWSNSSLS
jgi:hypothetical protein